MSNKNPKILKSWNPGTLEPFREPSAVKSILVIQLTKMGDFLQTTPLLYRIKQRYPHAKLAVLIDSRNIELAQGVPLVDEIIPLDLSAIANQVANPRRSLAENFSDLSNRVNGFKGKDFDLVYNLNFSKISALFSQFFKKARVIGYHLNHHSYELERDPWVRYVFHLMNNRSMLRFNLVDLLASYENNDSPPCPSLLYGNGIRDDGKFLPYLPEKDSKVVGFQMGCGGSLRRWPVERFGSLGCKLAHKMGARLILFGSKEEEHLGKDFIDKWRDISGQDPPVGSVTNLIGKTSIPELAGNLKKCDLLITGDTGTMHLATAVGTKVLALFMGTALCHETGPYGNDHFVIQAQAPCFPCTEGKTNCQGPVCQELITPEIVYEFISFLFKEPFGFEDEKKGPQSDDLPRWDNIQIYRSAIDGWGVNFLPLIPRNLSLVEIVSALYREVGRKLMRPSYQISPEKLIQYFSRYYNELADDTGEKALQLLKIIRQSQSEDESFPQNSPVPVGSHLSERIEELRGLETVLTPLNGFFKDMQGREILGYEAGEKSIETRETIKTLLADMSYLVEYINNNFLEVLSRRLPT
jgi:ADP-heptose:LPS heptosyltransferase